MKYVLGVDGGNTKTDYMLFDGEGTLIRHLRRGTVSHEAVCGGFAESERLIREHMDILLDGLDVTVPGLSASALGLAGLDIPSQYDKMREVLDNIGFSNYAAVNDGFLGLKAATSNGFGVCSINGTGTVAVGINSDGKRLQVGGVGLISGDEGGAWHIARCVVRSVYDSLYRCGEKTAMSKPFCELFGIKNKNEFTDNVTARFNNRDISDRPVNDILFDCAAKNDETAVRILENSGAQMALSAAGCAKELGLTGEFEVVLAGSMWAKPETTLLVDSFKSVFTEKTAQPARFLLLKLPPVCGAVLWALELAHEGFPDAALKNKVLEQIAALDL